MAASLFILQLLVISASAQLDDELDRPEPIEEVYALSGSRIDMPCDVTPMEDTSTEHQQVTDLRSRSRPWLTDPGRRNLDSSLDNAWFDYTDPELRLSTAEHGAYLVLWFIDPDRKPIYSFDVRDRPITSGKHWWDEGRLGRRGHFFLPSASNVSRLQIVNVSSADAGIYRCRVDYKNAPTKNYKYRLVVVEPPSAVLILDNALQQLSTVAGPLEEGTDLILTCRAVGGSPVPWVTWWHGGQLVDNNTDFRAVDTVSNRLIFQRVSRRHLHDPFTCQVTSSAYLPPVMKTVTLELLLRPLFAEILLPTKPLNANQSLEVRCRTAGSRPTVLISWWKGNKQIQKKSVITTSDDGNVTVSVVTLALGYEDDGKLLYCRAENPMLSNSAQEDFIRLDVHYTPVVRLTLGSNIHADDIKEGDDLYLECHIKSNPAYHKLIWTHNGMVISHNATVGVILSNVSLVLQSVARHRAGNYTCIVTNSRGETSSSPLPLRIQYAPRCRSTMEDFLGVSKQETAIVNCDIDADPPDVHFWWTFLGTPMKSFNSTSLITSGEVTLIPKSQYTAQGTKSTLSYIPKSDLDFGLVACWASNSVGNQREPCLFHVVPAGKPRAPMNCTVHNRTADSLRIDCQEAFDGGLEQIFGLEVVDPGTRGVKFSLNNSKPSFVLSGLEPETALLLSIYAVNSKGRSEEVGLEAITLRAPEKHTGLGLPGTFQMTPLLAVLIGAAATLLAVVLAVAIVVHRRQNTKRRRHQAQMPNPENKDDCSNMETANASHKHPKDESKSSEVHVRFTKSNGEAEIVPTAYNSHLCCKEPDIILRDLAEYPLRPVLPAVMGTVSPLQRKPDHHDPAEFSRGQPTIPASGWCTIPDLHSFNSSVKPNHPWDVASSREAVIHQDILSNSRLPESSL